MILPVSSCTPVKDFVMDLSIWLSLLHHVQLHIFMHFEASCLC